MDLIMLRGFIRCSADPHIAKAVEGKPGLPLIHAVFGTAVIIRLILVLPDNILEIISFCIHSLTVFQRDDISFFHINLERDKSHDILSRI